MGAVGSGRRRRLSLQGLDAQGLRTLVRLLDCVTDNLAVKGAP
jgi:hypothetical protein